MSMALLATPPLAIAISALTAHGWLDRTLIAGVVLISLGILLSVQRRGVAQ
jgi:drug/metabolite transporter (DMT)-like permease